MKEFGGGTPGGGGKDVEKEGQLASGWEGLRG